MIITPERLTELAQEEAERRANRGRLVTAFMVGSVARGEPLLAGCTDIDVILVHSTTPIHAREIVALSPDVHFDIYHHDQSAFEPPRDLRTNPDLGPSLYHAVRLHDPDHYFDWVQAAACAQFSRPDNQLARSRAHLSRARERRDQLNESQSWVYSYVRAALDAANAIASLAQGPASGRRLLFTLRGSFLSLEQAPLFARFQSLYGAHEVKEWELARWLGAWAKAYDLALENETGDALDPVRRDYFLRAFQQLAEEDQPEAVLLPLLLTWSGLPQPAPANGKMADEIFNAWSGLVETVELHPEAREARGAQLESFLDDVERYLLRWGDEHGA